VNILHIAAVLTALSSPLPDCECTPTTVETPSQAAVILSSYDLVFVGSVSDRKYTEIDPEYFGQNVRKILISFDISQPIKGEELGSVTALVPMSAACERFPLSIEFLVLARLVNGIYRIEYCSGTKRTGPETDAEIELLLGTATPK
jgi:hypothetical protein